MAAGSHEEKGNWALFVILPARTIKENKKEQPPAVGMVKKS
jgi:hypothetical protein